MNVLVYGIGGTMGGILNKCIGENGELKVVCGVDKFADKTAFGVPVYSDCSAIAEKPDCIIDFSMHSNVYDYLPYAVKNNIPCVIATTGFDEEEQRYIERQAQKIAILKSGNMSLGINLVLQLSKMCAKALGRKADVEIIEQHHNRKTDAPSGTALLLADGIKSVLPDSEYVVGRSGMAKRKPTDIGISSVRGGTIVGKHEVMFIMDNEIITIKHEAESRQIFANGSISAAKFIVGKPAGLYSMQDIFKD
jgi:4-hydroxy-tetrahydrodipicolinate reductase